MSVENEIIGFVIGFGGTILVGLITFYLKYIRKESHSYLLEFDNNELKG